MEKNVFDILKSLNQEDIETGTRSVGISNQVVSAILTKRGSELTFGFESDAVHSLMSDTHFAIAILIDRKKWKSEMKKTTAGNGV